MQAAITRATAVALVSVSTAIASDIPVGPGQSIQSAINFAQDGDRVLVKPSTYLEAINFLGKNIEVIGIAGALATTIDATGLGTSTVTITTGETPAAVLRGFRIVGGTGTFSTGTGFGVIGGGILADGSTPTIEDCVIQSNSAGVGGGAFLGTTVGNAPPVMRRCVVRLNSANSGGGVYGGELQHVLVINNIASQGGGGVIQSAALRHCRIVDNGAPFGGGAKFIGLATAEPLIEATEFEGNQADYGGGAFIQVAAASTSSIVLRRCAFRGNHANSSGGGLYMSTALGAGFTLSTSATVSACVFRGDSAPTGAGAYVSLDPFAILGMTTLFERCVFDGDDLIHPDGALDVLDSIFVNHPAPIVAGGSLNVVNSITPVAYPGTGSFNANPMFVDPAAGDVHLTAPSPCVDAGASTPGVLDFDGDDVVGLADIGADERVARVYAFGSTTAGGSFVLRVAGTPGDAALLFVSPTLAPAPIPTSFGAFGLGLPILFGGPLPLGIVPANGVIDIPATMPAAAPLFATFHVQAVLQGGGGGALTNVETIVVLL